jgi:hypothetical protein
MSLSFDVPQMSVSMPKMLDWHMILDHELTQLTRPEMGFIGSLGFVGLGSALGLTPQLVETMGKVRHADTSVTMGDIACVGAFFGCAVLAIVCLGIGGLYWYRHRGLAQTIRTRGKQGFTFPVSGKAA